MNFYFYFRNFYGNETNARQYILFDDDVIENELCAVFYNESFYRGQIEKGLGGDNVQVIASIIHSMHT